MAIKSILLKNNVKVIKKSMSLNEDCLEKWNQFLEKNGSNSALLLTAALENFIEEYEEGRLKVLIEL